MDVFKTDKLPGRTLLTTDGKEYLWFGGTDYLGMGHHPQFRQFLNEGIVRYGMHYGSSRNGSVRLTVFEETERLLAEYVCSAACILTSSGMLAGRLVMLEIENIVCMHNPGSIVRYHDAADVHPAIQSVHYVADDMTWAERMNHAIEQINASGAMTFHIICTDAIGSPFVTYYDFSVLDKIKNPENVYLIVDQSHTLGVRGQNGTGIAEDIPPKLLPRTIFVSSLNKAMGIPAGAIWGPLPIIEKLRVSRWFTGASPSAPAYIYAFQQLLNEGFYQQAFDQLIENVSFFWTKLRDPNQFCSVKNYPVFCSLNADLPSYLLRNEIMPTHFAYPSPADPPVTRIVISALHQQKDLDRLAEVCNAFKD